MKEEIKTPENTAIYRNPKIYYIKTIETYCVSCKKNTANKSSRIRRCKQIRLMLISNCAVLWQKTLRLIKNWELH